MPIHPEHRRTRIVTIRFSDPEYAAVERAASCARSVSDWLREVVLSHAAQVPAANEGAAQGEGKGD
jgi:hypothetical protein